MSFAVNFPHSFECVLKKARKSEAVNHCAERREGVKIMGDISQNSNVLHRMAICPLNEWKVFSWE